MAEIVTIARDAFIEAPNILSAPIGYEKVGAAIALFADEWLQFREASLIDARTTPHDLNFDPDHLLTAEPKASVGEDIFKTLHDFALLNEIYRGIQHEHNDHESTYYLLAFATASRYRERLLEHGERYPDVDKLEAKAALGVLVVAIEVAITQTGAEGKEAYLYETSEEHDDGSSRFIDVTKTLDDPPSYTIQDAVYELALEEDVSDTYKKLTSTLRITPEDDGTWAADVYSGHPIVSDEALARTGQILELTRRICPNWYLLVEAMKES